MKRVGRSIGHVGFLRPIMLVTIPGALAALAMPARAASPADCGDTKIDINGLDALYESLNDNGPGKIGPRRLVVDQVGTVKFGTQRMFVQGTPMDDDRATLTLKKTAGRAKTQVTICSTDGSGTKRVLQQFDFENGTGNLGQVRQFRLSGLKDKRLSVRLVSAKGTNTMSYSIELARDGAGNVWSPNRSLAAAARKPVVGWADLHAHQSSPLGFGGGLIAGDFQSSERFPRCAAGHAQPKGITGLAIKQHPSVGNNSPTSGTYDTGHGHHCSVAKGGTTRCWSDTVHQKMDAASLEQAHKDGLRLLVTHAVSNQAVCVLTGNIKDRGVHCSDMEAIKRQILGLKRFDEKHAWYTIVRDPWEARRAIARGQLAVVLGVETSNIFPQSDGNALKQLHELYAMGVRVTYLAHESNTDFAGAAFHHWPFLLANSQLKEIKNALKGDRYKVVEAGLNPALVEGKISSARNPVGLKPAGRTLLNEMMRLNMLVDIDHLSYRATDDVFAAAKQNKYYPLFAGHTRIDTLLSDDAQKQTMELVATDKILGYVRDTGGMVGLRTGPEAMRTYSKSRHKNDCPGSVKSFSQFYQWYADRGYKIGFGTDFGGYVPMIGPRWGADACPARNKDNPAANQGAVPNPKNAPSSWKVYVDRGMVDVGTLSSVVFDLDSLGVDTKPLRRSAEDFLRMWERTYETNRGKVP
ncbi:MAG: membrane dipeptidase [Polyangiaceae bacterium]